MVIQLKDVFNMIKFEKSGDRYVRDARKVQCGTYHLNLSISITTILIIFRVFYYLLHEYRLYIC